MPPMVTVALVVSVAILVLAGIYALNSGTAASPSAYAYQVGRPGPGARAPEIRLASTDGHTFDLASLRGQTVLLFFQEGIGCEPCWDQLRDIQAQPGAFRALRINRIVSITSDPLAALTQKVAAEGLAIPVLSNPDLAVSAVYQANQYGMMGTVRDGHSFILVGKDGVIRWRADYGGPPSYPMYIPLSTLHSDIRAGLRGGAR